MDKLGRAALAAGILLSSLIHSPAFANDVPTAQQVYEYGVKYIAEAKKEMNARQRRKAPKWNLPLLLPYNTVPRYAIKDMSDKFGYSDRDFVVFQKISNTEALCKWVDYVGSGPPKERDLVWISGADFSESVDGSLIEIYGIVRMLPPKQYQTSTGSNTIIHLQVLPEGLKKEVQTLVMKSQWVERKWTDATGNYSTKGKLTAFDGKLATIEKAQGGEAKLPIEKLSPGDRAWLRKFATLPKEESDEDK